MKTSIKLCASFILALSAVACTTETIAPEAEQEMVTITLSTDGPITVGKAPETKTGLSKDGRSVVWKTGDDIALFLWPDTQAYKLDIVEESINESSAKFSGKVPAASLEAVQKYLCAYPYSESVTATSATEIANVTLPSKTKLASGGFYSGTNVSVATYADSKLTFKNLLGLLHIKVTGDFKFKKMKVTAEEVNTPEDKTVNGKSGAAKKVQIVKDVPMTGKGNVNMETYVITPASDAISYIEFEQSTNQTLSATAKNYYPAVFPTNITEGNALAYTLSIVEDETQDIYTQRIRLADNTNLEQCKALDMTATTAFFTKNTDTDILAAWNFDGSKGYESDFPATYTKAGLEIPYAIRGAGFFPQTSGSAMGSWPSVENSLSYETAVSTDSYIGFTLTPEASKVISITGFDVYVLSYANSPNRIALSYSTDGTTFTKLSEMSVTQTSSRGTKHSFTFDSVTNIDKPVIVRLYVWKNGEWNSNVRHFRIKAGNDGAEYNMVVKGTIQ